MTLSLSREIAYDIFASVINERKKPEELLDKAYETHGKKLKRLDRNFIKQILYGSLRWHSKLYWILQNTSKRDLDKSSPEVVAALVVGTYQIYYMDRVPDRAAVNESVEYVRKKGQASACSFVNGILRQISRRSQYFQKPDKNTDPVDYLSIQFAHPKWLVRRWSKIFKFERLKTILSQNNEIPPFSIRSNTLRYSAEKTHELQSILLKNEGTHSDRRPLRNTLRLKEVPKLGESSLFDSGHYTIQDEASQLIGLMVDPLQQSSIIDACAGPGGKLSHIYELGNETLDLIAIEKDPRQMERAKQTMSRLGHKKLRWELFDFMDFQPEHKVDKVLLDAPCSGLGVLRRHPEGKWQKTENAIKKMSGIQREMIDHALTMIKEGGELIFSTCSFEKEEGESHLSFITQKYGQKIEVISPADRIPDYYKKYILPSKALVIYSSNSDELDGFSAFIVKVKEELGKDHNI